MSGSAEFWPTGTEQDFVPQQPDTFALPRLARGWLANLIPPGPEVHGVAGYLPGMLTGAYSGIEAVRGLAANYIPGLERDLPPLPGAAAAQEAYDGSRARAASWIPAREPTTPDEQTLGTALDAIGGSISPGIVAGLPGAVGKIARIAAPVSAPLVVAPLALGAATLAGGSDASAAQPPPQQPDARQQSNVQAAAPGDLPVPPLSPPADGGQPTPPVPVVPGTPPLPPDPGINVNARDNEHDSWWTFGTGLAAGAGLLLAAKYGPALVESTLTLTKGARQLRLMEEAEPLNQYVMNRARGNALGGTEVPGVTPPGTNAATTVQGAVQDDTAPMQAYLRAIAPSPTMGDKLASDWGLVKSDAAYSARLNAFAESGYDPASGVQMPSFVSHWQKVANLSPADRQQYSELRYITDELDNRRRNLTGVQNAMLTPGSDAEKASRVMFPNNDTGTLQQWVAAGKFNPPVQALLDEANDIHRSLIRVAERRGYFSSTEASALIAAHPNYMPTVDVNGHILDPFEPRDLTPHSGSSEMIIPAWEADKQHVTLFMRTIENNEANAAVVRAALAHQSVANWQPNPRGGNLMPAQIFEPSRGPVPPGLPGPSGGIHTQPVEKSDASTISVRMGGTTPVQHFVVNSPAIREAMTRGSVPLGAFLNAMSAVRSNMQKNATGLPGMVLGGYAFPAVNAVRGNFLGSIDRPRGTSFGLLDAATNKLTGGRVGLPGDSATAILPQLYGTSADMLALGSKYTGNMLTRGNDNTVNNFLRTLLPNSVVDAIQTRLHDAYMRSLLFERKRMGITGSEGYGNQEVPTLQVGANKPAAGQANTLNNTVPDLFRSYDPRIPFTNVRITGLGKSLVPVLKFNSFMQEIFNVLNESAQAHYYRLNAGKLPGFGWAKANVDPSVLALHSRQLTGDMGASGGSPSMRAATAVTPFLNPIVQDISRLGKAIKDRPIAASASLAGSLVVMALGSVFSSMLSGQQAVDHFNNQLSDAQKTANVYIYHPGSPPENATQLSLPQRVRPFFPFAVQAAQDLFGVGSHFLSDEAQHSALHAMTEFFGKHITYDTLHGALVGASQTTELSANPALNAAASVGDKQIKLSLDQLAEPNSKPIMDRIVTPTGGSAGPSVPGRATDVDPTTASVQGKIGANLLKALYAVTGEAVVNMSNAFSHTYNATGDLGMSVEHMVDAWEQHTKDRNPWANGLLWQNTTKLSFNTPLVQQTENKLAALALTKGAKANLTMQGGIRRGSGAEVPASPEEAQKITSDPQMQQLYMQASLANASIRAHILPPATDVSKQIHNLDTSGMSPQMIRQQQNALMPLYQQRMARVADQLADLEHTLSAEVGGRVVLEHIDWNKGVEQFRH